MSDNPITIGMLSLRDLEFRLGLNRNVLIETADTAPRFYRPFIKRGSKPRRIDNPTGILKDIQARIQLKLLARIPLPGRVQGGVKKRSPITNASKHLNADTVVTLDIRKCFPSITNKQIFHVWRNILGCSPTIAHILTKLTTFERHLPQGAPTSTTLANLVLSEIDECIDTFCQTKNVTYSRFVDDLIFSGTNARSVINEVVATLKVDGFRMSHAKMKIMGGKRRHQITGIVANRKLGIPQENKAKIRAMIHRLRKSKTLSWELRSLMGKINFVSQVNPAAAASLSRSLAVSFPEVASNLKTG